MQVRVEPKSTDVEIDLSVDTTSENYDSGASSAPKLDKLMVRLSLPAYTL